MRRSSGRDSRLAAVLPSWTGLWVRDSGLMLLSQVLATLATSGLAVIVARSVGPADFGLFSAFLAISFALSVVTNLGISAWLLRELSRSLADTGGRLTGGPLPAAALWVTLALGVTVLVGGVAVAAVTTSNTEVVATLAALLGYTVLLGAAGAPEAILRARRRLRLVARLIITEKVALLGLASGALALGLGVIGVALGYAVAGSLRLLLTMYLARQHGGLQWGRPPLALAKDVARSSIPFALNSGVPSAIVRLDPAVVGVLSVSAAGLFAVGDRVIGALLVVPTILTSTLYPHLARTRTVTQSVQVLASVLGICGCGLALGIALSAPTLVPAIFGHAYGDAIASVQIMSAALPCMFAAGPLTAGLFTLGRERRVVPFTIGAVAFGTLLVLVGQGALGLKGAAVAYVARQVLYVALLLMVLRLGGSNAGDTRAVMNPAVMGD